MSKILVLAGGSVKGAYQTGVVRAVFESGFILMQFMAFRQAV
jgi:NTE family protein